jgi:hypothetical protein
MQAALEKTKGGALPPNIPKAANNNAAPAKYGAPNL